MQFIISKAEFDPKSNFYLKNYLILLTICLDLHFNINMIQLFYLKEFHL